MEDEKLLCPDCGCPDGEFCTRVVAVATVNLTEGGKAYNALDMEQDPNEDVGPFYTCTFCGSEFELADLKRAHDKKYNLLAVGEVPAYFGGEEVPNAYKVWLHKDEGGKITLIIKPGKGTSGFFSWYLSTLLGLPSGSDYAVYGPTYRTDPPHDKLMLDGGQDWYVRGMLGIYHKIVNEFIKIKGDF